MNTKKLMNNGWAFAKSSLEATTAENLDFQPVDLPHDWLIYDTLNLYENSIGWYRREFTYTHSSKQIILAFDGVYMDSTLYVNQKVVGEWKYGYSSFMHDITEALVEGSNEILMKVVHQRPNSRWYSGAGIYRNVWLIERDINHIIPYGAYITIRQNDTHWQVTVDTEVSISQKVRLCHTIFHHGEVIASSHEVVEGDGIVVNQQVLTVTNPLLWSMDEPNLYQLQTLLYLVPADGIGADGLVEEICQCIGFRTIVLDPNDGFLINEKKMKLNGVCEHHDLGALGAAFNKTALIRRFRLLKEMGVNAIRTAHNMPAPELMDLADEMGFLVISEAFDMWERPKNTYDYARFFLKWHEKDVKSWVMRDRNHPSLLMWSIGNEIYDTHADKRGQEITRMLADAVRKYDPKENARVTIGSNYMPWQNAQKCADILKIAGYNYAEKYYDMHHQQYPDWVIYGSETASVVQSRGIYHFPFDKAILADDDEQCSSLGNSTTSWGAKSAEACIIADRDAAYSLGQFIWTGFDYIGEPTPYHTKNSYFGQLDTATFQKDAYYIYQSAWTDYRTNPMIHIFPYWDFNSGQMIDVRVASNAPRIELQLNGEVIGTHEINHKSGTNLVGTWKIPYLPGKLVAYAYDEKGSVIATDTKKSFTDAANLCLVSDKQTLVANGTDLIFVEITVEDKDGNKVENASNRVHIEVTGAGRLVGLDNGDSTDYDPYKGKSRRLFSGKLMAIIAATFEPGIIRIHVTSQGLKDSSSTFEALPYKGSIAGISAFSTNKDLHCIMGSNDEIPVRKIELISSSGQEVNESCNEIVVHAKLYPENTSYSELEWSVVNDSGIPSNIAMVKAMGDCAKVSAIGDGAFRLRCTSKNGTDKVKLISELEFTATGFGPAFKDPYQFISAGLYDYSRGDVGSGNERGIATSRDGETHVGFRNIDFGTMGSDTITLPIFALSSDPYAIQIWEGMPGESGSLLIADVVYQKPSIWNVYQEETYQLSKHLTGITSLCFVLHQKVHIKGFLFRKRNRAFEQNDAASNDRIYGDSYKIAGTCIEHIGNNVSIEFEYMDFTDDGATKLILCGHSPIDKNTIQIRFSGSAGESIRMVEFTHSNDYTQRTFSLEKVTGKNKVTFIFLPGSNFDFGWFRFEP